VGPPSRCNVVRSNVINEFLVQRQADASITDASITHCFVASVRNPGTVSSAKAQVRFRGYTSTDGPLLNTGRLIVIHPKRYDAFWALVREPDCYPNGLLEQ